jgi:hypothetical protein
MPGDRQAPRECARVWPMASEVGGLYDQCLGSLDQAARAGPGMVKIGLGALREYRGWFRFAFEGRPD